ncbi:YciI family protein [Ktedonospora formicarum]|nr:YciI family protein [Ktedonospora formicarum]
MKYLLLFCANAQQLAEWQELSDEARAHKRAQASEWLHDHRSQIRKSYGLHLPHTITSVHVGSGGQPLVTDGPFLEGTEVIGGIAEIEVADLDEALHLAKAWSVQAPGYNVVEIWPLVEDPRVHV